MSRLLVVVLLAVLSAASWALGTGDGAVPFLARLNARFPETTGAKVAPSFAGFWSVVKGQDAFFVRDDLSVAVRGEVIDLQTGRGLLAELRAANRPRVDVRQFPRADAVVMGKGSRRLYVFSDPDCPFCRSLDAELAKLHDVEVWLFPFPLAALHPDASRVAASLWCQPDRASAWRAYAAGGKLPRSVECSNPVARNVALGERLGFAGTPTLVLPDGRVIPGFHAARAIEALLSGTQ